MCHESFNDKCCSAGFSDNVLELFIVFHPPKFEIITSYDQIKVVIVKYDFVAVARSNYNFRFWQIASSKTVWPQALVSTKLVVLSLVAVMRFIRQLKWHPDFVFRPTLSSIKIKCSQSHEVMLLFQRTFIFLSELYRPETVMRSFRSNNDNEMESWWNKINHGHGRKIKWNQNKQEILLLGQLNTGSLIGETLSIRKQLLEDDW